MKILVTGCRGQLGTEMRAVLERIKPGITVYTDIDELNLCDRNAVERFLTEGNFTHVVNCAAYTAVDRAEDERLACTSANVDAVANIARMAETLALRIVHVSTDYVFDGHAYKPYTESDKTHPLSQYGSSKRKGETSLLALAPDSIIVRTGWLYSPHGNNFVKTVLRLSAGSRMRMVADQIGTPTYAADLAEAIATIVFAQQWVPGIFNYSNEGVASWYDFAVAVQDLAGITGCPIEPIPATDYPTPAERPYYSVLDKSRIKATYGITIPHWRDSLRRCITRLTTDQPAH